MNHWWRAYDEAVDDPKLIMLSDKLHRAWFGLCCISSAYGGVLPRIEVIAIKLRMKPDAVRAVIAELVVRELIDQDGHSCTMHNWDGRQYRSDGADKTNAARQQRYRERKRNVTQSVTGNAVTSVTHKRPDTDTEAETEKIHDRGSACASLVSSDASKLAEEIATIIGYPTPDTWPPSWMGAPMRLQAMLDHGWKPEVMIATAREVVANKRDGPPSSIAYFEKPFAKAHARQASPLPVVAIAEQETIRMRNPNAAANGGGIKGALARLREQSERLSEGSVHESGRDVVGLIPHRRG